jgi:hypothetical protein
MRFLFLDFDGVLNRGGEGFINTPEGAIPVLLPELVGRLSKIVAATNCTVVYSTSWRVGHRQFVRLYDALERAGATFKSPRYATPDLARAANQNDGSLLIAPSRGNEIAKWFSDHVDPFCDVDEMRFVVLDDMSDAWPVRGWEDYGKFIQTTAHVGLTEAQAEEAIAWLLLAPMEKALPC